MPVASQAFESRCRWRLGHWHRDSGAADIWKQQRVYNRGIYLAYILRIYQGIYFVYIYIYIYIVYKLYTIARLVQKCR